MADIGGALKLLFVLAICGGVIYSFWMTLERGSEVAALGRTKPVREAPVVVARGGGPATPKSFVPPAAEPVRTVPSKTVQSPAEPTGRAGETVGGVYKWVDEKGTVHFSDRPISSQAVNFTPAGTLVVADFPRNNPAADSRPKRAVEAMHALPPPEARRPARRSADYQFSVVGGFQQGDEVILSGRVAGPECRSLRVHVQATSRQAGTVSASTVVRDVDPGSRVFKVAARSRYQGAVPRWEVAGVQGVCLD